MMQGNPGHFEFFVTGFSLTGNTVKQTGIQFILMCIILSGIMGIKWGINFLCCSANLYEN